MSKLTESLKYVTLLCQINRNRINYIKAVLAYRFTKHPKTMIFPEMVIKLYDVKLISRANTQDSAFLSLLYERELTKYLLNVKPNIFVDVGSHIGRFSVLMAKRGSKVTSIEPSLDNYKQLKKNVLLNHLYNVEMFHVACSNKDEQGKLLIAGGILDKILSKKQGATKIQKKFN